MGTKVFARDELVELGLPDECEGGRVLSDRIVGTTRWAIVHEVVWRMDDQPEGMAYMAQYRVGATEKQEERPWENKAKVTATEVREVERVVKVWEPIDG
jgi:hypothetical protein